MTRLPAGDRELEKHMKMTGLDFTLLLSGHRKGQLHRDSHCGSSAGLRGMGAVWSHRARNLGRPFNVSDNFTEIYHRHQNACLTVLVLSLANALSGRRAGPVNY
ncbi:hypothetical protein NDU88_000883 [Pleurodeles waltl]|uniref:Uncharacterized protein n=1 Tax=Pleurodeles waltl TaxID=8319 RepID=A0AAV7KS00_PLEWA|nr:hypothetical protein NDU88_000883 [Pleurodeles waltl]